MLAGCVPRTAITECKKGGAAGKACCFRRTLWKLKPIIRATRRCYVQVGLADVVLPDN